MLVSAHVKVILAWITYTNTGDVGNMRKILAPNFLDQIRPLSLKVPDLTREPFLERMAATKIHYGIRDPKPEDIVETGNRVVIWTNSNGTTEHGFPWINEYVIRFTFDNKDQITNVYEWADPNVVTPAFEKEAIVAQANLNC